MPWKESSVLDERLRFVVDYLEGGWTKKALCDFFGISRPTGDKWLARYLAEGPGGLEERSRRPLHHPWTTSPEVVERIVAVKQRHQSFGPKKVMDLLRRNHPEAMWPSDSTAGEILKRHGLVKSRRLRRRVPADPLALWDGEVPGDVWSVDFKGHIGLGDGTRCHPLTLADNVSRMVTVCRALGPTNTEAVLPWMEWAFRVYGLPLCIRSDNGPPFASTGAGGLTRLSLWLVKLGVRPQRIRPGKPQENGRHERMHRSLKAAVGKPAGTLAEQQRVFDRFVEEYNWARSHEALGRRTPGSVHQASPRPFPERLPEVGYDEGVEVRRVRKSGEIKWRGNLLYLSSVLPGEPVGLTPLGGADGHWEVRFGFHLLGVLDERLGKIRSVDGWHRGAPGVQSNEVGGQ